MIINALAEAMIHAALRDPKRAVSHLENSAARIAKIAIKCIHRCDAVLSGMCTKADVRSVQPTTSRTNLPVESIVQATKSYVESPDGASALRSNASWLLRTR